MKKQKQFALLFAASMLAAATTMATTVNFTAAEGYSGGGAVQLWVDSLHAQGGGGSTI
jgi:hypothetical protein